MTIFLIAEITAVSTLVNYISGTDLWITASIVIVSSLIYTLYGGLRASLFTDNIQFVIFGLILLIVFFNIFSLNSGNFNPNPWSIKLEGLINNPQTIDLEKLLSKVKESKITPKNKPNTNPLNDPLIIDQGNNQSNGQYG